MRRLATVAALAASLLLCACGSHTPDGAGAGAVRPVSLVLDFTPNAVHVGIYTALARGYDRAAGMKLHVIVPGAATDAIRLLTSGRATFAILDIHDLAIARAHGQDIVGVLPIVQRPLASVIAAPAVRTPTQLMGRTVGVTGDPSDLAVLDSIVSGSGGNPRRVKTVGIGFNAIADLLAGKVTAATAFWNDEGVVLRSKRPGVHVFRVDDYGAPAYPELVVCATGAEVRDHPGTVAALRRALTRGYDTALADPSGAARALESQVKGLDASLVSAELPGLRQAFTGPEHRFGVFDPARLRAWARWERRFGIVTRTPDVSTMFDISPR